MRKKKLLAILATGERSRGYIAQTLPKKPKSPLQHYRLLRKGKDVLA
jgi:hypothetical protein